MSANQITPAVGSVITADLITGRIQPLRTASDVYERPGLDSHGVRTIGTRSTPCALRVLCWKTSYANAKSFAASVRALVGTYITVEYELAGQTDANVYVLDVQPGNGGEDVRASLEGSSNTYLCDLVLIGQKM